MRGADSQSASVRGVLVVPAFPIPPTARLSIGIATELYASTDRRTVQELTCPGVALERVD